MSEIFFVVKLGFLFQLFCQLRYKFAIADVAKLDESHSCQDVPMAYIMGNLLAVSTVCFNSCHI